MIPTFLPSSDSFWLLFPHWLSASICFHRHQGLTLYLSCKLYHSWVLEHPTMQNRSQVPSSPPVSLCHSLSLKLASAAENLWPHSASWVSGMALVMWLLHIWLQHPFLWPASSPKEVQDVIEPHLAISSFYSIPWVVFNFSLPNPALRNKRRQLFLMGAHWRPEIIQWHTC